MLASTYTANRARSHRIRESLLVKWIKLLITLLGALTLFAKQVKLGDYVETYLDNKGKKSGGRQDKSDARLERLEAALENVEKLNQLQTAAIEEHQKIINRHARWIWGLTLLSFGLAIAVAALLLRRFHS